MPEKMLKNAVIVAPQPEAVEVGAGVLERGGNAIDAAIACAFAQGVVDPQMAGLGGFGSMNVFMPQKGVHDILEFYARAPAAATPEMWQDKLIGQSRNGFGFILEGDISEIGYLACCTPGSLKGYEAALRDYGTFNWEDVIRPAIHYAREGFPVRPHMRRYWNKDPVGIAHIQTIDRLRFSETGRQVYFDSDGQLLNVGDTLRNPDLGHTLERIAASGGSDIFYRGEIAEQISSDFQANGGLISKTDLEKYSVSRVPPIWGQYRGHSIATSPPPGSGFSLLQLLNILEHFDLAYLEYGCTEHVRILFEAMKRMTIDKDTYQGDPEYEDIPIERLLSREHAEQHVRAIKRGERAFVNRLDQSQRDTTHISVVDRDGNAVAMTHTLGSPSGAITKGLGFMYNGTMSRFDPRPRRVASITPFKRRASSAVPAIIFRGEQPYIVIGAPGGSYIAPTVAQGIMNMIDFGMNLHEAVSAPRVIGVSNTVDICNRIRRSTAEALRHEGYEIARSPYSYAFAGLHAIHIENRIACGAADPGRDGSAIAIQQFN